MSRFQEIFSQHVGAAFARQLAFADFLGDRNWSLSVSKGLVSFGDDLQYPIQLLGTEAHGNSTWLWAWANDASNLPADILHACHALRMFGEREGISEFTDRTISLDVADGHRLALIASGIQGQSCYYRGPYEGGALFFLIPEAPPAVLQQVASERVITVITEVISQFEVDHRKMAESFFASQGFGLQPANGSLTASRGDDAINITFDELGRLANIEGTLQPRRPSKSKPWWQLW